MPNLSIGWTHCILLQPIHLLQFTRQTIVFHSLDSSKDENSYFDFVFIHPVLAIDETAFSLVAISSSRIRGDPGGLGDHLHLVFHFCQLVNQSDSFGLWWPPQPSPGHANFYGTDPRRLYHGGDVGIDRVKYRYNYLPV